MFLMNYATHIDKYSHSIDFDRIVWHYFNAILSLQNIKQRLLMTGQNRMAQEFLSRLPTVGQMEINQGGRIYYCYHIINTPSQSWDSQSWESTSQNSE